MTTDTIYCVDYTTMDHYSAEKEFNGPDALRNACVSETAIKLAWNDELFQHNLIRENFKWN